VKRFRFGQKDIYYIAILRAWILAYIWLLTGERYVQFIEQGFQPLLVVALVISVLFLIALVFRPSGSEYKKTSVAIWLNTGLLLLPLIYVYSIPPDGLDNYALSRRVPYIESTLHEKGRPLSDRDTSKQMPNQNVLHSISNDSTFTVSLTDIEMGIDSLSGRHIRLIGRVSRDTLLPDGYFFIFRYVITCCAAHAMPMSLPVVEDSDAARISDDAWIEVIGSVYPERMVIGEFVFDSIPVIYPGQIRQIDPPNNPYISSW